MSAPSLLPVWDSSNVNVAATTPTHQVIGYANGEVPTSAEINYFWALLCAWIAYLNTAEAADAAAIATLQAEYSGAKHVKVTRVVSPCAGVSLSSSGLPGAGEFLPYWVATASGQLLDVPLPVYAGERIVNVRVKVACATTDAFQARVSKLAVAVGASGALSDISSVQTSAGHLSKIEHLTISALNYTAVVDENYLVRINCSAFGSSPIVWGVEVDVDNP